MSQTASDTVPVGTNGSDVSETRKKSEPGVDAVVGAYNRTGPVLSEW